MHKKTHWQKVLGFTIVTVCVMATFFVGSVQAATSQSTTTTSPQQLNSSFSAIPLVFLLLPIAAAAAYILEWGTAKTHKPEKQKDPAD